MRSFTATGSPCSGPSFSPCGDGPVGGLGERAQLVALGEEDDGVQRGVDGADAVEVVVEDLHRGELTGADRGGEAGRGAPVEIHYALAASQRE